MRLTSYVAHYSKLSHVFESYFWLLTIWLMPIFVINVQLLYRLIAWFDCQQINLLLYISRISSRRNWSREALSDRICCPALFCTESKWTIWFFTLHQQFESLMASKKEFLRRIFVRQTSLRRTLALTIFSHAIQQWSQASSQILTNWKSIIEPSACVCVYVKTC